MSKALEALERIKYKLSSTKANGYWEDLDIIETALKALEIIKNGDFSLEFDESQGEWFLYISNEEQSKSILVAKGTGVKTYDLLSEVLL